MNGLFSYSYANHRPRLVSMCKYMGIQPYGTDAYLRHMLRSKLSGYVSYVNVIGECKKCSLLSIVFLSCTCQTYKIAGSISHQVIASGRLLFFHVPLLILTLMEHGKTFEYSYSCTCSPFEYSKHSA